MSSFLLSIDQGTSSSRAILFTPQGEIHAIAQKELKLYYPQDGWVEQNPQDIVDDIVWAVQKVIRDADITPAQIAGVGITNQRETTVIWDKNTGAPVYNAIVWQDRRTSDFCATLKREGLEKKVIDNTGLVIHGEDCWTCHKNGKRKLRGKRSYT